MVVDRIENIRQYTGLFPYALQAIESAILQDRETPVTDGRHELDNDILYMVVETTLNGPDEERDWEAHARYIDLQYVADGGQRLYWTNSDTLKIKQDCLENEDYILYQAHEGTPLDLHVGDFVILWPQDKHRPGCVTEEYLSARMLIFKIKIG